MIPIRSLLPLFALLLLGPTLRAEEPFRYPEGKHGTKHELKYRNGLPVLVVSGSPEEMGAGVGALAVKPAQKVLNYPRQLLKFHGVEGLFGVLATAGQRMLRQFPADYLNEMEALVKSSHADRDAVVAGNTLFDLKKLFHCSAVLVTADRSATGGPLLARNLDHPSLGYVHHYSLVTVYRPTGKHAFVSVGFPGLVGCLSGMNDAGLAVAILEVFDVKEGEPRFDPQGVPYALCYRKLLEECATIAEARKRLECMRRTTTTNLVVADRKGVAVFEVTPGHVVQREAERGILPCTNHFCATELKSAKPHNVNETFERFQLLAGARNGPAKLTPDDLRKYLDGANLGEMTLQTMTFDTANLKLYLSIGSIPASKQPMKELDLKPLFKGS